MEAQTPRRHADILEGSGQRLFAFAGDGWQIATKSIDQLTNLAA